MTESLLRQTFSLEQTDPHSIDGRLTVGYWRSDDEPDLPDPRQSQHRWTAAERVAVIGYLRSTTPYDQSPYRAREWGASRTSDNPTAPGALRRYRGSSKCRICGEYNGSECHGDYKWQWPSGLLHYIEEHNVVPDREFVDHVLEMLKG